MEVPVHAAAVAVSLMRGLLTPTGDSCGRPPLQARGGGGGQGLGNRLFAFGGAKWPLATAHSYPLGVRMCFCCVPG